jgi:hypothetical protein
LIFHGKHKPRRIMLPNTMNCAILNIHSSITNFPIIHLTIIRHKNYHWKTLKAFIQKSSQNIQEFQSVTMSNSQNIQELTNEARDSNQFMHQAIVKMEGEIDYLVAGFNRIEEEEFQSQFMARGHYMIDEHDAGNSCHELVPATTILESEKIVDNNKEEEKDE